MLSAFFWGYTMTQVIGGYLSDRVGGDIILATAAVGWSLLTFWTPVIMHMYSDKAMILTVVDATRVLLGCMQGKVYLLIVVVTLIWFIEFSQKGQLCLSIYIYEWPRHLLGNKSLSLDTKYR